MSHHSCAEVVGWIGAYVDDQLSGAERMSVASHLAACGSCAQEEADIRGWGQALRLQVEACPVPVGILEGLADGVTSRISAEEQQSWQATWNRAFEDWHWVAVGVGSVTAAVASFVLASLMVYSSISQLSRMNDRVGTLSVMALPQDGLGEPVLMLYEQSLGSETRSVRPTMPASFGWEGERALVRALDAALRRSGRPGSLAEMSGEDRAEVLALARSISQLREQTPVRRPGGMTQVIGIHLETSTSVSASGI